MTAPGAGTSSSGILSRAAAAAAAGFESDVEQGGARATRSDNGSLEMHESESFLATNEAEYDANRISRKKTRPLKIKKKLYEFYAAPITKYYSHSVSTSYRSLCDMHHYMYIRICRTSCILELYNNAWYKIHRVCPLLSPNRYSYTLRRISRLFCISINNGMV